MRLGSILLALILVLSLLTGCAPTRSYHSEVLLDYFDTVCVISAADQTEEEFQALVANVRNELEADHRLFDRYHAYDGMENLFTVNEKAGKAPVEVDPKLFELFTLGVRFYELTGGKVNIALGAVLDVWHDAMETALTTPEAAYVPKEEALREANRHTDISKLVLDAEHLTVFFEDPEMKLDVGALAKGFAADLLAQRFQSETGISFNLGGEIRLLGQKKKDNWTIGIQSPNGEGNVQTRLSLADVSVATSGDYLRYFEVDGQRYHHIISPETLYPASGFVSVTVVSEWLTNQAVIADALSTALFCMSLEEGQQLIDSYSMVEALWILGDGTVVRSAHFSGFEK